MNEQNFGSQGTPEQVKKVEEENLTDAQKETSEERETQLIKNELLGELDSITAGDEDAKKFLVQVIEKLSFTQDKKSEVLEKNAEGKYFLDNVKLPYDNKFIFMESEYYVHLDILQPNALALDYLKKNGMKENAISQAGGRIPRPPFYEKNEESMKTYENKKRIWDFTKKLGNFISKKEGTKLMVSGSRDRNACYYVTPEKAWFYGLIVNHTNPSMDAIKEYCQGNNLNLIKFLKNNQSSFLEIFNHKDERVKNIEISEMEKIIGEN